MLIECLSFFPVKNITRHFVYLSVKSMACHLLVCCLFISFLIFID